jgi:ketosteroid isomerase-like protein
MPALKTRLCLPKAGRDRWPAQPDRREGVYMSIRRYAACATVATLLIVGPGCAQREPSVSPQKTVDLAAEREALLKRDGEWLAAVAERKDAAKIASFFTEDAVMAGTGEASIVGREALTKAIQGLIDAPVFEDKWQWDRVELSPDGRLAHMFGSTQMTMNDASGKPVTTHSRLFNVWRKDADGLWRCVVDVWVEDPAQPASSSP